MALRIVIKTQGGHQEGMGDITSSLSIAEEFRAVGHEPFLLINNNEHVVQLVSDHSFSFTVVTASQKIPECVPAGSADIAILNQLNTPEEEIRLFRDLAKVLVTVDDTSEASQMADLRFNVLYPREGSISEFQYIALSDIYRRKHNLEKTILPEIRRIMVTQGGSDTYGFTPLIIEGLGALPASIDVRVVLGPNFRHFDELNRSLKNAGRSFEMLTGLKDLSDLIMDSDLVVSAGGNTLLELACLGTPAVVVCAERFENETADRLQREGFGVNLGFGGDIRSRDIFTAVTSLMNDYDARKRMSESGKALIDGNGARRIAETVNAHYIRRFGPVTGLRNSLRLHEED